MARTDPQTNIRLPLRLKERLAVAARASNRTMNAEIVQRLERSFSSTGEPLLVMMQSLEAKVAGLEAKVAELPANLMKVIGGEADPPSPEDLAEKDLL